MSLSTEPPTPAEVTFASEVLTHLLHRIEIGNANAAAHPGGYHKAFLISHAWTDGADIALVYTAPSSDQLWGLLRDTRESLIDLGPWMNGSLDAAINYYLLDLAENWPGRHMRGPDDDPATIQWSGDDSFESALSDLPGNSEYTAPPADPAWVKPPPPALQEPRRYANPD